METRCPECGSRTFVFFNNSYMCCDCNREFGPKCPECSTEMELAGSDWVCPTCRLEIPKSDIELPKVPPEVYQRALRNRRASRGGEMTFGQYVLRSLVNGIASLLSKR